MKHMKKLLSLVLTLVTVFALSATAMAATVTIPDSLSGHDFVAYQIFTGTQADSEGALGNVQWGDGINDAAAFLAALKDDDTIGTLFKDCTTAADVAKAMVGMSKDNAEIVANLADANKKGNGTALKVGDENTLANGYYLIVDDTNLDDSQDANNPALLNVTGAITIDKKYNVPSVVKKVKDTNDSTGATSDWQDSADHDIGDEIEFQLTGTLPSNYADYETYKYVFHDTMTKLTYKADSVQVKIDGTVVSGFTTNFDKTKKELTVSCANLKAIEGVTIDKDSKIVVTYIATLDSDANIGATGNPNVVKLEFSNNPNYGGDGDTGFTPEDKVTVFTFKVIVNKTDGTDALAGAGFTLYKKDFSTGEYVVGAEVTGEALTTFEWKGLDDGNYRLSETTTPPGYNTAADIEFTITAEHEIKSDDPQLTKLECNFKDFTIDLAAGSLTTAVVNNQGTLLPETGGIGTTIFYVLGGVMMAGAVVLMVTKRRMNAER